MHRQSDALKDIGMPQMAKHEGPAAQSAKQQNMIEDDFFFPSKNIFFLLKEECHTAMCKFMVLRR
jgi:hypothetical protein